jgi:hypothetical protein
VCSLYPSLDIPFLPSTSNLLESSLLFSCADLPLLIAYSPHDRTSLYAPFLSYLFYAVRVKTPIDMPLDRVLSTLLLSLLCCRKRLLPFGTLCYLTFQLYDNHVHSRQHATKDAPFVLAQLSSERTEAVHPLVGRSEQVRQMSLRDTRSRKKGSEG